MADLSFLGKGIKFPFSFSVTNGGVAPSTSTSTSEGVAHVAQSIYQIVLTGVKQRFMRRSFGSRVRGQLLKPQEPERFVQELTVAVAREERRARIKRVSTEAGGISGVVTITVDFIINSTNVEGNLVFPFYLQTEAENPPAIGFLSSLNNSG